MGGILSRKAITFVAGVAVLLAVGVVVTSRPARIAVSASGTGDQTESLAHHLPVDTDMQAKLSCPQVPPGVETVPGVTYFDPPANSGDATPALAVASFVRGYLPDTASDFKMTGVNSKMARFENGRAILIATFVGDGRWYVTQGNHCWDFGW